MAVARPMRHEENDAVARGLSRSSNIHSRLARSRISASTHPSTASRVLIGRSANRCTSMMRPRSFCQAQWLLRVMPAR